MTALAKGTLSDRPPDQVEIKGAEQLGRIIASQMREGEPAILSFALKGEDVQTVSLAPVLAESLLEMLRLVSSGRGVRITPVEQELTTQQAADILNVSRPFLVMLLENGEIPHNKVGRHRRVRAEDLFAYKKQRDEIRAAALDDLARIDQEQGLL